MQAMNKKIYISDWLALKPYTRENSDDLFYLRLSNDLKKALISSDTHRLLIDFFEEAQLNRLCCFLASYVEDLVSETQLWNTFVHSHEQLYGKALPVYNTEAHAAGEVNEADVCFLIWYFINCNAEEELYSPVNIHVLQAGLALTPILDAAWEIAPENERLKAYFSIGKDVTDYYLARKFMDKLLFDSYLFHPDTRYRLFEGEMEVLDRNEDKLNLNGYLNEMRDSLVHRAATKLLAMRGRDWAAAILPDDHPLKQSFSELSDRVSGLFLYKGQDETHILIEHIATDRPFKLFKSSFEMSHDLTEINAILFLGMVRWQGEWWFSGIYNRMEYNERVVSSEKSSMEAHAVTAFLDKEEQPVRFNEFLKLQERMFLDYNEGSPIAFLPSKELQDFCNDFISFYNKNVFTSPKEYKTALKNAHKDRAANSNNLFHMDIGGDSGLVFMNPNRGLEIVVDCNAAFALPNNPYYNEAKSEEDLIHLILDQETSPELVAFLVAQCADELPFFESPLGIVMRSHLDFFLRFTKAEHYHAKPRMSMVDRSA